MSAAYSVACDREGCDVVEEDVSAPDFALARMYAGRRGWSSSDGEDYCPEHAETGSGDQGVTS